MVIVDFGKTNIRLLRLILRVSQLQLDLIFMQRITIQELFVTLKTYRAPSNLVGIVLGIRSCFVNALLTIGLSTKLAELELFDGRLGNAASVAHERAVCLLGLFNHELYFLICRHLGLSFELENGILRIEKTPDFPVLPEDDL